MKKMFLLLAALCAGSPLIEAQVISGASNLVATEVPHTTIPYRIEDKGTKLPDIIWGLDLAWISEGNLARGANYAGDLIDIVRLSFQTTYAVENGQLSAAQKAKLDERIGYVKKWTPNAGINLNSDQEAGVIDWYHSSVADPVAVFPPRWAATSRGRAGSTSRRIRQRTRLPRSAETDRTGDHVCCKLGVTGTTST